jgi:hypothetical protein
MTSLRCRDNMGAFVSKMTIFDQHQISICVAVRPLTLRQSYHGASAHGVGRGIVLYRTAFSNGYGSERVCAISCASVQYSLSPWQVSLVWILGSWISYGEGIIQYSLHCQFEHVTAMHIATSSGYTTIISATQ